jgi:serine/threonine protein kinase
MAPEIVNGENYNYKVDSWSVGCIIYELCTLNFCFFSNNLFEMFDNIKNSNYQRIETNEYGDDLKVIVNVLLEKDYKQRASLEDILNLANSYIENNLINFFESNILENNDGYKSYIIQWLKEPNQTYKDLKDIKLLYRGSRDGFKAVDFHEKCNNKGETLVIIKSNEDYIFGGYTEINWDNTTWNGKVGENNNSRREGNGNEFVFTLKNPHNIQPSKFNMKNEWLNHSICCDAKLGPIFGCNDIRIENECNNNNNSFSFYDFNRGEYCFNDTTGKKRLLFTGTKTYKVKEIEVFNIIR